MVWELIVKPDAFIVVSQSVSFSGARMGVTPTSPGPNKRKCLGLERLTQLGCSVVVRVLYPDL